MYVLSQVLVTIADGFEGASMLTKKKISLVFLLLISDVLYATHYLLLGALTGCFIVYLDVLFLLSTYLLEKHNKEKYVHYIVILTAILSVLITILTWNGAMSLLPMFATISYLAGMFFSNVIVVKTGSVIRNILNIIYLVLVTSYFGAVLETLLMICGIVGIILSERDIIKLRPKFNARRHRKKKI